MVAKCFKRILLLLFITGAIQANAQEKKKSELQQWKDSVENARLIARQERHLMDSVVHIKAENALHRKEFVLESDELTLKHGEHGYVNSTTNFIALHDGKRPYKSHRSSQAAVLTVWVVSQWKALRPD